MGELKTALINATSRIKSMSLIHELIHINFNLTTIIAKEYLQHLNNYISNLASTNKPIETIIDCTGDLMFNLQTAVPVGVIVNELLLNSVKHAKPLNGKIQCNIKVEKIDDTILINYFDVITSYSIHYTKLYELRPRGD